MQLREAQEAIRLYELQLDENRERLQNMSEMRSELAARPTAPER